MLFSSLWSQVNKNGIKRGGGGQTKMHILQFSLFYFTEVVLGLTLEQTHISMTKEVRKSVYISCKATGLSSSNYVHWYQQKDSEALRRILYVISGRQDPIYDNHPEANDFKVRKQSDNYELKIEVLKEIHSGVYYCASWGTSSHSKRIHSECIQKP